MDLATLTLFLPACFALNMTPGPNNLLSVSPLPAMAIVVPVWPASVVCWRLPG
jgi:hypothetical protein